MTEHDQPAENRRQQSELYGAPLAEVLRSIGSTMGLSQAEIARLLGLSAPMLSHLISGRRVKIGNPVAGSRLSMLRTLTAEVEAGEVDPEDLDRRLQEIASSGVSLGSDTSTVRTQGSPRSSAREVQQLFRTVAGALDWIEVADLVADQHPQIAELLRVYGAGRADAAEAHWARTLD